MVRPEFGTGPMKPSTPVVNKALCRLVVALEWCGVCSHGMGWAHWSTWPGHWLRTNMLNFLGTTYSRSWTSRTPTTMGYSSRLIRSLGPSCSKLVQGAFWRVSQQLGPPRLPNMNPIERLWDVLEESSRTQDHAPTNSRELWVAIQTALVNISPQVLQSLVESMHQELLHFARLEEGLRDIRPLSHDFWQVSVY